MTEPTSHPAARVGADDVERVVAALPDWLPSQRWFGGKDQPVTGARTLDWTLVQDGEPALVHLVVEVEQGERTEAYQLLLGRRSDGLPDVPASAAIAVGDGPVWYEASGDADVTTVLLDHVAAGEQVGALRFEPEPGAELTTGLRAHPISSATLTTRAPRSASWRVQNGAAIACSSVTTVMPSNGRTSAAPGRPRPLSPPSGGSE